MRAREGIHDEGCVADTVVFMFIKLAQHRTGIRRSRGGAFLEFSLLIPFFLALIFLVLDVGLMLLYRSQVINVAYASSRQAAQYGAFGDGQPNPQAVVKTKVENSLLQRNGGPLPNSTVSVQIGSNQGTSTLCTNASTELRTTVTYNMTLPFDFFGLIGERSPTGPNTIALKGTGVARCEIVR